MSILIVSEQDSAVNGLVNALKSLITADHVAIDLGRHPDPVFALKPILCDNYQAVIQLIDVQEMWAFPGVKNIGVLFRPLSNAECLLNPIPDKILSVDLPIDSLVDIPTNNLFSHKNEILRIYYEEDERAFEVLTTYMRTFNATDNVILYFVGEKLKIHMEYIRHFHQNAGKPHILEFGNAVFSDKKSILDNANCTLMPKCISSLTHSLPYIPIDNMRDAWLDLSSFAPPAINMQNTCENLAKRILCELEIL